MSVRPYTPPTCAHIDCSEPVDRQGICYAHHQRLMRAGARARRALSDDPRDAVYLCTSTNGVCLTAEDARELADHLHTLAGKRDPRPEPDTAPEKDTDPEEAPAPAESLETTARRRCMALDTFHSTASSGSGLPEKTRANLLRWLAGETATLGDDR